MASREEALAYVDAVGSPSAKVMLDTFPARPIYQRRAQVVGDPRQTTEGRLSPDGRPD